MTVIPLEFLNLDLTKSTWHSEHTWKLPIQTDRTNNTTNSRVSLLVPNDNFFVYATVLDSENPWIDIE